MIPLFTFLLSLILPTTLSQQTNLAVGSFTQRSFLDAKGVGITLYSITNNKLINTATFTPAITGPNPGYLAIHPPYIYALNSEPGSITRITFSPSSPFVTSITTPSNTLSNAHLKEIPQRGPRGARLVLMASFRGNVTSYISAPNSLKLVDTFSPDQSFASEIGPFQDRPRPHQIMPYRGFVLVPDLGSDIIWILKLNKNGKIKVASSTELQPGDGPRHVAIHPKGFVYLANQLSSTIVLLKPECGDGILSECERKDLLDTPEEPAAIRISADGRFVYVSVRISPDQQGVIVGYEIDQSTGSFLNRVGQWGTGGVRPRDFFLSDPYVAVVNRDSNNLVLFQRDISSGSIGDQVSSIDVGTPVSVVAL